LTYWRSHKNSSKIDSIVSAVKWNLQLQIISITDVEISDLTDKLSNFDSVFSFLLVLLLMLLFAVSLCLDVVIYLYWLILILLGKVH
jgi:hypothetical protein